MAYITNFPGGLSSFGIPSLGSNARFPFPKQTTNPGKVMFVNSTSGIGSDGDGNDGTDSTRPLATIGQAVTKATAGAGDMIVVFPGTTYTENLTIAKNDITIVAAHRIGNSKRVVVAPATGIALTVGACHRLQVIGLRLAGTAAVGVKHSGEGAYFEDCDFTSDTSHGLQFFPHATVQDYTGSGALVVNSIFRECGGAGIQVAADTVVGHVNYGLQATNVNIYGNQFYLNTDDDINDDAAAGTGTYFSQWCIAGNYFMTRNKTTYLDLNGGSGSTELLVAGNFFADDAGLNNTKIQLPAGGVFSGNFDAVGVRDGSTF